MPNYDMGTAHGRIRIDYEGDGFNQTERGFDRVRASASETGSGMLDLSKKIGLVVTALTAFGPAAAAFAAAGVAAAGTLAAAFVSAGAAVGAFQAAVKPQFSAIEEVGKLYTEATKAIDEGSDKAKEKVKAYREALARLPPATQQTAVAFFGLKNQFQNWSNALSGTTMPVFTRGIMILRSLLPQLTPFVKIAAAALNDLMMDIQRGVQGPGFATFIRFLRESATMALPSFIRSIKNMAVGFAGVLSAFLPFSHELTGGIEGLTAKFAAWGQSLGSSSGFAGFMNNMREQGPVIGAFFKDLLTIVTNLIVAFGPFLGISIQITTAFADLIAQIPSPALSVLIGVITALTVAMKLYQVITVAITAATKAWAIAQRILNISMLTNPVFLIVAAIVALVAIIVIIATKTDWFSKIWDKVWGGIKTVVGAVVSWVVNFVKKHWQLLLAIMMGPMGILLGFIFKHWNAIKKFISGAISGIIDFVRKNWRLIITIMTGPLGLILSLVTKYWTQIKNFIFGIGNAIANFVRGFINRVLNHIRGIIAIVTIVANAFNRFNRAIIDRANAAIRAVGQLRNRIFDIFRGAGSWLYNAGKNIIQGLINGLISMFRRLQDTLGSVTRALPDWKGPPSTDRKLLVDNGQLIMQGLIRGFQDMVPRVQATLNSITNVMQSQTGASLAPVAFGTAALSGANASAPTALSATATLPDELVDRLVDAMERAGVGTTVLDGEVISRVVGKIQGRAASFQRRTR